jgi:putative DNA primase/helicase
MTKKPEPLGDDAFNEIVAALSGLGILFPPPSQPMAVARKLMEGRNFRGLPTLKHWRSSWMRWEKTHWTEIEDGTVRAEIYERLEQVKIVTPFGEAPWEPNRYKINDVLDALRGITHLPTSYNPPCWLPSTTGTDSPVIAATNGLLDVHTRQLRPLTPGFFNLVSVPFDYDPDAPTPTRWLKFLDQLWPDDEEAIEALRDWFGYVLSGRTDLQKIFVIIGPIRSGKGTIARILKAMIGKGHVASPTMASLGTEFGLAPLLGKSLAVIGDARLGGKTDARAVVERLLSISGEDSITVNRKFKDQVTVRLPTRFMIISNELPAFGDASGAIASRFILTTLTESFLGKENTRLEQQLMAELPGILNWALVGLDRISRQSFTVPKSSQQAVAELQDLVSPMSAFVRDCCNKGPECEIRIDTLYGAYRDWRHGNGLPPVSKLMFGRDLHAVLPRLRITQPRHDNQRRWYAGIQLKPDPWDSPNGRRNGFSSVSPVSPVSPASNGASDTDEGTPGARADTQDTDDTDRNPLPPPMGESLDAALSQTNGRCPDCKWHVAAQGHRADCPQAEAPGS